MVLRTLGFSVTIQLFTHMLVLGKSSLKAAFLSLGFLLLQFPSIRKHPPRPQLFSFSSCTVQDITPDLYVFFFKLFTYLFTEKCLI